jgi:hypothetical protein
VLARAERDVLRALRECFSLTSRGQKDREVDTTAFVRFATLPLGDDGFVAPPAHLAAGAWQLLLDLKPSLWRAERERLDAQRPFAHPALVFGIESDAALGYAVGLGRPTIRAGIADVAAWLAAPPAGAALDWLGQRVCAFARAQPERVRIVSASEHVPRDE